MAFKALQMNTVQAQDPVIIPITQWAGINELVDPSEVQDNEFTAAQNIQLDTAGAPDKRYGYKRIWTNSLGAGKINGAYRTLYKGYIVFCWGTAMYKKDPTNTNQPVSIMTGLANSKAYFFVFNDKLFMMNGTDFVYWDGTSSGTVESIAYIPYWKTGTDPKTGGGTILDPINYLQPGFKIGYFGDGVTTVYKIFPDGTANTVLDATTVVVEYTTNAGRSFVTKTEGTHFTVDRTNGTINFGAGSSPLGAPADVAKQYDNVIVHAYQTISGYATKIKSCNIQPAIYGGDNDTRVFIAKGNIRYNSGLLDATYWPIDGNYIVGSEQSNITGFSQIMSTQVILKEHKQIEPSIWVSSFQLDSNNAPYYPTSPVNSLYGCDAPDTIQSVNNFPTFLDIHDGAVSLENTNAKDERAVTRMSDKTNKSLLAESNLQNAISFLWRWRYGVCVNGNAYVYDYRLNAWYGKWTNINASCFIDINGTLYFGDSTKGLMYKFIEPTLGSSAQYNDDGITIHSYFDTKDFSYNDVEHKKLLSRLYTSVKPYARSSVIVSFITSNNNNRVYLPEIRRDMFDYSLLDYSRFTYSTNAFAQAVMRKVSARKVIYIRFRYENNNLDESMGIVQTSYQIIQQSLNKNS